MSDYNFNLPETLVSAQAPPLQATPMSFAAMLGAQAGGSIVSGLFNARQAKKQMQFQEHMANTQYQRAAKDLQAAGLNRIIALGDPAAAPAGAAGQMPAIDAFCCLCR